MEDGEEVFLHLVEVGERVSPPQEEVEEEGEEVFLPQAKVAWRAAPVHQVGEGRGPPCPQQARSGKRGAVRRGLLSEAGWGEGGPSARDRGRGTGRGMGGGRAPSCTICLADTSREISEQKVGDIWMDLVRSALCCRPGRASSLGAPAGRCLSSTVVWVRRS